MLVNRGRGNDELAPGDELFADFNARKAALEQELGKGSAEAPQHGLRGTGLCRALPYPDRSRRGGAGEARRDRKASPCRGRVPGLLRGSHQSVPPAGPIRIAEERFGAEIALKDIESDRSGQGARPRAAGQEPASPAASLVAWPARRPLPRSRCRGKRRTRTHVAQPRVGVLRLALRRLDIGNPGLGLRRADGTSRAPYISNRY